MRPHRSVKALAGFGALSTLAGFAFTSDVKAQPTAPKENHAAASTSLSQASLPQARTDLPSYVQKRNAFSIVLNTTVTAADRDDKQPFSGGDVVMMQACPPGYVGANSPMIRDYPMQLVTSMEFEVDGKLLSFLKAPTPDQTNYWTLDKDRGYGLDVIVLKFQHAAGTDVRMRAKYDGINGSGVYGIVKNTGDTLSAAEKTKYLGLAETSLKTTKEAMDVALSSIGMLRKPEESTADYALQVAQWTNRNIPYVVDRGECEDVATAIANKTGGNCNVFADVQAMMLRSQGVYARIVCGADSPNPDGTRIQHVVCEFWDDKSSTWFRIPQSSSDLTNATQCFAGREDNMFIFQVDRTIRYPYTFMRSPIATSGCGQWEIGENGKSVAHKSWFSDGANSVYRPITTG